MSRWSFHLLTLPNMNKTSSGLLNIHFPFIVVFIKHPTISKKLFCKKKSHSQTPLEFSKLSFVASWNFEEQMLFQCANAVSMCEHTSLHAICKLDFVNLIKLISDLLNFLVVTLRFHMHWICSVLVKRLQMLIHFDYQSHGERCHLKQMLFTLTKTKLSDPPNHLLTLGKLFSMI